MTTRNDTLSDLSAVPFDEFVVGHVEIPGHVRTKPVVSLCLLFLEYILECIYVPTRQISSPAETAMRCTSRIQPFRI